MQKLTIELSPKELDAVARITGTLLGYAISDRYCDREIIVSVFNVVSHKLSEFVIATVQKAPLSDGVCEIARKRGDR